ncbi:MAG: type II toxin-antitoxin system RelB/DinJ family antitoxin [Clostridia bacterium]|nr:type II toxin-antitoxin system RelB/DinJ family antitoxin [Clostridia bacterium]
MARTANIYTRVDPIVKEQAEQILEQLGIPMSSAIGMFLRQVVMQNGIPFDMKLPLRRPLEYGKLTKEEFDAEIRKGIDDAESGKLYSADEVEAQMKSRFNV